MTVSALPSLSNLDSLSTQVSTSTSSNTSAAAQPAADTVVQAGSNIAVTSSTASAILATVSIPSGSGSHASPPLSTDTIQLLQDLSTGNFTAAKSDVAKVQLDLQTRQAPVSAAGDSSLNKLLTTLKESLEQGKTGEALNILTGILSKSNNVSGSIVNTSA